MSKFLIIDKHKFMMNLTRLFLLLCIIWFQVFAYAALEIEISGGGAQQIPIAIAPFSQVEMTVKQDNLGQIVQADLKRSGLFRVLDTSAMPNQASDVAQVKYSEWAALQAQVLVVGKVESISSGRFKVNFHLLDVYKQTQLLTIEYIVTQSQLRLTAHKIADEIYQKLTGEGGIFASRIAYITKIKGRYILQVSDADGYRPQPVISSNEPIISPAWSPDGAELAYVSFEKKKPIIFVQSLTTGNRRVLANFKGNNSAPAWSPDGSKLAIVLTYGANSQIYTINADGTELKQLAKSHAIDTEPTWSPDGQWIYFSSDRGGKPQIYKVPSHGGDATRVTFEGVYNVSPRIAPDGKLLTYIRQEAGKFRVALQDLITGQVQLLSEGSQDESPSFAPNGRVILYATRSSGKGGLAAVSVDGKVKQKLKESIGDVREPAWGVLLN